MKKTVAKKPASQEEILAAIRAVAKETKGGRIRLKKFLTKTNIQPGDIYRHFASWNGAVAAAGYDCRQLRRYSDDDELLADWGAVARKLKGPPSYNTYDLHGKYSAATFQNRFRTWLNAGRAFCAFAEGKPEWADVLRLCPAQPSRMRRGSSTRARLSRRMQGRNSPTPAKPMKDRPTFGDPVDGFPGLLNAPMNENGVILAFGIMAGRLGFQVHAVRPAFPDCIAMRYMGPGAWQEVKIEFEYESRNFRTHRHAPDGCDILVCWEHNWEDCPPNIEVIALNEEIERLREAEGYIEPQK